MSGSIIETWPSYLCLHVHVIDPAVECTLCVVRGIEAQVHQSDPHKHINLKKVTH